MPRRKNLIELAHRLLQLMGHQHESLYPQQKMKPSRILPYVNERNPLRLSTFLTPHLADVATNAE